MILIVAAAILGAALGLFVQPRLFALALGLAIPSAAHLVLVFVGRLSEGRPNEEAVREILEYMTFAGVHGIWPVMAAAAFTCLFFPSLLIAQMRGRHDRLPLYDAKLGA